jgi:CRP-like cAMP-binding protein
MLIAARFRGERRAHELQLAHALRSVPFLRDVPATDLVAIWRRLQERRADAGTVICARGEPGEQFYMIQSGTLEVTLGLGPDGIPLRRLGPGDFFGEMSLLTGAPRSADVQVADDAVLWVLERRDFDTLLADRKSLLQAFTRTLCERVVQLTRLLEERTAGHSGPAGLRFGSYRVVEQIGVGGMSTVYSAVHIADQTAAAVKVLPGAWGQAPELRERLRREALALQGIAHPRVIALLEAGEVDERFGGGFYLAMEWIPHALDRVLRAQYPEPLEPPRALTIARGVAEGLAAIHDRGLVHRDVKPSNILLRPDGSPVLTDLGLATALAESARERRLTPTDIIVGTADYISPEQVAGTAVDERSDLYALGVVLYEMAVGYVPFAGRTPLETLRAQVDEPPPPLPAHVPDALRALIERALRKEASRRYASAAEMVETIDDALRSTNDRLPDETT